MLDGSSSPPFTPGARFVSCGGTFTPYYDTAAQRYPVAFKNYGFDAYLNYLVNTAQLVNRNEDRLVINVAGHEFLGYIIRVGKTTAKAF